MRKFIKRILLAIFPSVIKKRIFKHYNILNWQNLNKSKFDSEFLLLEFLIDKNTVFFDVGSNIGEYAYYAEKLISSKNIFLFEPDKKLSRQLSAIFPHCNVFNFGLSDSKGIRQFKVPFINGIEDKSLASLEINNKVIDETNAVIYEVNVNTLDNFVTAYCILPTLIKIDVEGHEFSVLKGAKNLISQHYPTFIIEIEQRHHSKMDVNEVFKYLESYGYSCYYYSKQQGQLFPYTEKKYLTNDTAYLNSVYYINNYIFIHQNNNNIEPIENINNEIRSTLNK